MYVAITSIDPLRIYIYKEGLVRFATEPYKCLNTKRTSFSNSKFAHLTNYSLNKKNEGFSEGEDPERDDQGLKWSLSALKKHLAEKNVNVDHVFSEIESIVIKTIISAEPKMLEAFKKFVPYRTNCFELLGFDVLLDSKLKPWLLEVNLAPSLTCDTAVDHKIKSKMVADLFTLAGMIPDEKQTLAADP